MFPVSGIKGFPEVGQKQKTEKKKRERLNDGNNNGQATHGARKHAWRTQAAWANLSILVMPAQWYLDESSESSGGSQDFSSAFSLTTATIGPSWECSPPPLNHDQVEEPL